jgi:hypothetical protein
MSYVYILSQTSYKNREDHENEENKDLNVLQVYNTAKAANEAAKDWVEKNFEDGKNQVKQDTEDCDTWTCELKRDDQNLVVISVTRMPLLGDPVDIEEDAVENEASSNEESTKQASEPAEDQEPPAKKARQA